MEQARINIICDYSSVYGGNFIPSIFSLTKLLLEQNCFVLFTFPIEAKDRNWTYYLIDSGFNVHFASFEKKKFKKEIKKINKENQINTIYTHFVSGLKIKLLYLFSKKMRIFVHVHSDFSGGQKRSIYLRIKNFFEHKVLRKDSTYIFVSKKMKEIYQNKRYMFVPNALCLDRIPCKKNDIELIKNQLLIDDKETVYLTFGWSPFVKGTDIAVKSFIESCKDSNNAKLIVVYGKGDGYKKCIKFLKENVDENILSNERVAFLPPSEDVFSYYQISDVFISSSRSEGFSYSILESLFFNLKVISSDIPGVSWSKKYPDVLFFQKDNVIECSERIKSLIGFKKTNRINEKLADEYNIEIWSTTIAHIILNSK